MGWVAAVQAIAAVISAASAASAASADHTSDTTTQAKPGGKDLSQEPNRDNPFGGQLDPSSIGELLAGLTPGGDTNLTGPTDASAAAAQATADAGSNVATTPPAPLPTPDDPPIVDPNATTPPPGQDIGQILSAIPQALAASANLLGINDTQNSTQRAAPVAGGGGGGLVGQFSNQRGGAPDIGQLLAALPGLR